MERIREPNVFKHLNYLLPETELGYNIMREGVCQTLMSPFRVLKIHYQTSNKNIKSLLHDIKQKRYLWLLSGNIMWYLPNVPIWSIKALFSEFGMDTLFTNIDLNKNTLFEKFRNDLLINLSFLMIYYPLYTIKMMYTLDNDGDIREANVFYSKYSNYTWNMILFNGYKTYFMYKIFSKLITYSMIKLNYKYININHEYYMLIFQYICNLFSKISLYPLEMIYTYQIKDKEFTKINHTYRYLRKNNLLYKGLLLNILQYTLETCVYFSFDYLSETLIEYIINIDNDIITNDNIRDKIQLDIICDICKSGIKTYSYVNCGHCCCDDCMNKEKLKMNRKCFFCGKKIKSFYRIYL